MKNLSHILQTKTLFIIIIYFLQTNVVLAMLFNTLVLILNVLTTVAGTLLDSVLLEQTLFKWLGHMLEQTYS
jgi:hypothetical protein